jgi:Pentapeptide repeats (9 copies)
MAEAFSRKQLTPLAELASGGADLLFVDEQSDDLKVSGITLNLSILRRIGARRLTLKDSSLRRTIFDQCYFRNASFDAVDFTGSTFTNCNLEDAHFRSCNFSYVQFSRTALDHREILANLPVEPNVRLELVRDLQANAIGMARKQQADAFLLQEIEADRQHNWNIVRGATDYYRQKYVVSDQVRAAWHLVGLWFSDQVWGFGLSFRRLFRTLLLAAALCALVIWGSGMLWEYPAGSTARRLDVLEAVYVALSGFGGGAFAELAPADTLSRGMAIVQVLLGTVFLGFFAAALFRRIGR